MFPFFGALHFCSALRVDELEELAGMDISRHNGAGYQKEQEQVSLDASISLSQKRRSSLAEIKSRKSGIEELQVVPDDEA